MTEKVEGVEGVEKEELEAALAFLDDLREDGSINMFGAAPWVQVWWKDEYGEELSSDTARKIWKYWAATFGERHP